MRVRANHRREWEKIAGESECKPVLQTVYQRESKPRKKREGKETTAKKQEWSYKLPWYSKPRLYLFMRKMFFLENNFFPLLLFGWMRDLKSKILHIFIIILLQNLKENCLPPFYEDSKYLGMKIHSGSNLSLTWSDRKNEIQIRKYEKLIESCRRWSLDVIRGIWPKTD